METKRHAEDGHYFLDVVGAQRGLPGGGLHVYFTGDLLHPPMVLDPDIWADGRRWPQGAAAHIAEIADLAELQPGEQVLDVGCGLGGPARLLARRFGVFVTSITNSWAHAMTAQQLNQRTAGARDRISVVLADCQREVPRGPFDAAVSINMLYQVPSHRSCFAQVFNSLAPGGRFVVDDWMLTPLAEAADLEMLARHFSYRHFARTDTIEEDLMAAGFPPAEKIVDFGHVGRCPMAQHFERQVRKYFAPQIILD